MPEGGEWREGEARPGSEGKRAEEDERDGGKDDSDAGAPEDGEPTGACGAGVEENDVESDEGGSGGDDFLGEGASEEGEGSGGGPGMAGGGRLAMEGADGGVEGAEDPECAEQFEALDDVGDGLRLEGMNSEEGGHQGSGDPEVASHIGAGDRANGVREDVAGDDVEQECVENMNGDVDKMPAGEVVATGAIVEPEGEKAEGTLRGEREDGVQGGVGVVEFKNGTIIVELPGAVQTVAVDHGGECCDEQREQIEAHEAEVGSVHCEGPESMNMTPCALEATSEA